MRGAHTVRHLPGAEQARGFDNGTLGMDPLGLDRVEPGTLDRQRAGQDAHALALLLDLPMGRPDPGAYGLTHVPGRIVPDQRPHGNAQRLPLGAAPVQELGRERADRAADDEAQPDLLCLLGAPQHEAIAGQGFGVGIAFGDRLFH